MREELIEEQLRLAALEPEPWRFNPGARVGGVFVGYWLRTRAGTRPLAVHAAWRTEPDTAAEVVLSTSRVRTPESLREARRRAREARAAAQ
jgi:hypothetical protein